MKHLNNETFSSRDFDSQKLKSRVSDHRTVAVTVSSHDFDSQKNKLRVSDPISEYIELLCVQP